MVSGRVAGYLYGLASSRVDLRFLTRPWDSVAKHAEFLIRPMIGGLWTHVTELLGIFVVLAFVARIVAWQIEAIVAPGLRHGSGE